MEKELFEIMMDKISDEIADGKDYAKLASECAERHPALSHLFYDLSLEEMDHMARLHNMVVDMIQTDRREHG